MILKKAFTLAALMGFFAVAWVWDARADQWDKKTILTISEPLQLPGLVLEPGEYVMKLANSESNRHIVQVFDKDGARILTTILAIPNSRLEPTGKTQFGFWEMPAGQPRALRSWFYPGDNFGQEFAYPKDMATSIARTNQQPVPAVGSSENMQSAQVETVKPEVTTPAPSVSAEANIPAPAPEPAPVAAAPERVVTPEPPVIAQQREEPIAPPLAPAPVERAPVMEERTLPETASPLPWIGLSGLLSLGGAALLRLKKR